MQALCVQLALLFVVPFGHCKYIIYRQIIANTNVRLYSSLSTTVIPYQIRINITFAVSAVIGTITFILSKKLNEKDYETAHAREEVVHIKQDNQQTEEASSSTH